MYILLLRKQIEITYQHEIIRHGISNIRQNKAVFVLLDYNAPFENHLEMAVESLKFTMFPRPVKNLKILSATYLKDVQVIKEIAELPEFEKWESTRQAKDAEELVKSLKINTQE